MEGEFSIAQRLVPRVAVRVDGRVVELDREEFEGALRAGSTPGDLGEVAAQILQWMAVEARAGRFPQRPLLGEGGAPVLASLMDGD